jgi:hypothetical protein
VHDDRIEATIRAGAMNCDPSTILGEVIWNDFVWFPNSAAYQGLAVDDHVAEFS